MAYNPVQLGQKTSANSSPVVIASDQSAIPVDFSQSSVTTVTWTASTGNNTASTVTITNSGTVLVTVVGSGTTITAGVLNFEAYDGTNWIPILGQTSGGYAAVSTYTIAIATTGYVFDVAAWQQFRVRLNPQITGTGSPQAVVNIQFQSSAADNVVTVGQPTAGNLNATVSQTGTWTVQPGNTPNTTPWLTTPYQNSAIIYPNSAALADTYANPTTTHAAADTFIYNGTTWDRWRSATSAQNTTGTGVPASGGMAIAATALPTAATNAQYTNLMSDKFGRLVVHNAGMRDLILPMTQLTLTSTTTETTLISATASVFNDIISLAVINTSTTSSQVDFRDSTAGTIRLSLYVPGGDTRGIVLPTPLPQNAVNNNWTAKCGTSVASVIITGTYITNK